jgi:hypothetical protein
MCLKALPRTAFRALSGPGHAQPFNAFLHSRASRALPRSREAGDNLPRAAPKIPPMHRNPDLGSLVIVREIPNLATQFLNDTATECKHQKDLVDVCGPLGAVPKPRNS